MSRPEYQKMTDQELNLAIAEVKSGTPKEEQRFAPPDYVHDAAATWRALMDLPDACMEKMNCSCVQPPDYWWVVKFVLKGRSRSKWHGTSHRDAARAVWESWCMWIDLQQEVKHG